VLSSTLPSLTKHLRHTEAGELLVPEQRLWRTVTRRKYQLTRERVRLQNQLESLLEEAHIKLSSLVSDLLGLSAQRMLKALADGETKTGGSGRFGQSTFARHAGTIV
jgi:transposase